MATHLQLASKLLRHAAEFFRSVDHSDDNFHGRMEASARVYEGVADRLDAEPADEFGAEELDTAAGVDRGDQGARIYQLVPSGGGDEDDQEAETAVPDAAVGGGGDEDDREAVTAAPNAAAVGGGGDEDEHEAETTVPNAAAVGGGGDEDDREAVTAAPDTAAAIGAGGAEETGDGTAGQGAPIPPSRDPLVWSRRMDVPATPGPPTAEGWGAETAAPDAATVGGGRAEDEEEAETTVPNAAVERSGNEDEQEPLTAAPDTAAANGAGGAEETGDVTAGEGAPIPPSREPLVWSRRMDVPATPGPPAAEGWADGAVIETPEENAPAEMAAPAPCGPESSKFESTPPRGAQASAQQPTRTYLVKCWKEGARLRKWPDYKFLLRGMASGQEAAQKGKEQAEKLARESDRDDCYTCRAQRWRG